MTEWEERLNMHVEAETRVVEPEPGELWVRHEATGVKTLTITVHKRSDWPLFDAVVQAVLNTLRS